MEKLFYSIQYKNGWSAASDLLFTESIKFYYTLCYHALRVQMFEKCDYQIDRKNEWLLLPARLTAKFELIFVLALENAFSYKFHLKANRRNIGSSKQQY